VILFLLFTYVTICMELDSGMHIGLHLVFFGKTGVTVSLSLGLRLFRVWFVLELEMLVSWIWGFLAWTVLTGVLYQPDRCRGLSVEIVKPC
jgi:hypothetical protein